MRPDDDRTKVELMHEQYISMLTAIGSAAGMSPAEARALALEVLVASLAHPWRIPDRRGWLEGAMKTAVERRGGNDV